MYFVLEVNLSQENNEQFFQMLWSFSEQSGDILQGVYEGDAFSNIPFECDSDLPPITRDWVGDAQELNSELYFLTEQNALDTYHWILSQFPKVKVSLPLKKQEEDWNKKWKEGFSGVSLAPFFYIYPPWEELTLENKNLHKNCMAINPGSGFGTGTHETTQMCMQIIGEQKLEQQFFLDFGCGSGILSIAMALQGGHGDAIDIDLLALDNAKENFELNKVTSQIALKQYLSSNQDSKALYDGVIANILKNVLIDHAGHLVERLKPGGWFIISGLLEQDVEAVHSVYSKLLKRLAYLKLEKNEWRALFWKNMGPI